MLVRIKHLSLPDASFLFPKPNTKRSSCSSSPPGCCGGRGDDDDDDDRGCEKRSSRTFTTLSLGANKLSEQLCHFISLSLLKNTRRSRHTNAGNQVKKQSVQFLEHTHKKEKPLAGRALRAGARTHIDEHSPSLSPQGVERQNLKSLARLL